MSVSFSEWSGQAGYPYAGRIPRKRSRIRASPESCSLGAYHSCRACS